MLHAFSADCIFPVSSPPVKNGVVIANDAGEIIDVKRPEDFHEAMKSDEIVFEKHSGIICPGFINAHCHLELSHMKGKIKAGRTLPGFIGDMIGKREADAELIQLAIADAEDEMISNGIVGVGDICNTADTLKQKRQQKLRYHNFIELFDITASNSDKEYEKGVSLYNEFTEAGSASLTPHAPYTVTPQLLKRIHEHAYRHGSILSIHNQETESENEMFLSRSGALFEKLSSFGSLYNGWNPTGFSSMASALVHLPRCNKTLLVHNTYSTPEDITWAHLYSQTIHWCFCPNANLFIENHLPDFQTFIDSTCRIMVGTDSYASNHALSILEELKTISSHAPKISLDILLRWATMSGAEFFGWDKDLGSFEKGKRPGINLVTDVHTEPFSLTETSVVKKLL
jgi:cytosine/adenosine deaminase-related metal-dependent hydrolase